MAEHDEEKFMPKDNFKKVITLISIFFILFALSVPYLVYAKMKAIEDADLAKIQGADGVTIGLNLTVGTVSGTNTTIQLSDESGGYIRLPWFTIDNGFGGNFAISTNLTVDVGSNVSVDNRHWVYISGIVLPSNNEGMGVSSNGVNISGQVLGNLDVNGIYLGRDVSSAGYTAGTAPWVRISTNTGTQGIAGYAALGLYVNSVSFAASPASSLTVSGLYVGSADDYTTGPALIGFGGTGFDVNVGTNSTTDGTMIRLSMPMQTSIHVNNFTLNGNSFGPITLDNVIFYRQWVGIRNNL